MTKELHVSDVLEAFPPPRVMLWRAVRRRCPRCGASGVLRRWFHLRERCPECGVQFRRDEAFFLGVFTVNLVVTLTSLFFVLIWLVLREAADQGSSLVPPLTIGALCATVLPVALYPLATMVWSALDLSSDPLDVDEIAAAVDAIDPFEAAVVGEHPPRDLPPESEGP